MSTNFTSATIYRADIDGLRAIAVIIVLVFHAFPTLLPGGFIGVDIFFVISGFLIGGILIDQNLSGKFTYTDFYARRIRRLFPALSVMLITAAILGFFLLPPSEYERLGTHIVSGVTFISNIQLMKESGYFDVESTLKPLLHLWSLGVEEQFYILFPILITVFPRNKNILIGVIILIGTASFLMGLIWLDSSPHKAFFHPAARFWELFIGVLVAIWLRTKVQNLSVNVANLAAISGLLLIGTGLYFIREGVSFPGWWALLPVVGAAFLIGPGRLSSINRTILSSRVLVRIGLISYPLYLWHWPLLYLVRVHHSGELPTLLAAGALLLSAVLAWCTWRLIETPLRHGGSNTTKGLIIIMLLLGVSGFLIKESHGVAQRYPEAIRSIIAQEYNGKAEARAGTCFMKTEQKYSDFSEECYKKAENFSNRTILLWGDSHAAHLYPGLSKLSQEKSFSLMQLTASGCPPIIGLSISSRPACAEINSFIFKKIGINKPEIVVLGGYWHQYNGKNGWSNVDVSHIQKTIASLQQAGVKKIIMVGQVPIWKKPHPSIIISLWDERKQIVDFTNQDLDISSLATDRKLQTAMQAMDVNFVSPTDIFCKAQSCMTFSTDARKESVAFDYGHLTMSASYLLAKKIFSHM